MIADLEGADAAAGRLRNAGHRAAAVKVDVASEADTAALAEAAAAELGGVDILVNNAAIFSTPSAGRSRRSIPRNGAA